VKRNLKRTSAVNYRFQHAQKALRKGLAHIVEEFAELNEELN
jgi:hypothetical protein